MNHKWKKITRRYDYIQTREEHTELLVTPSRQHECVRCGLRKGYSDSSSRIAYNGYYRGMDLVFFDADKILSRTTLPFGCGSMNYIKKSKMDTQFLTKEDFIIK